MSKIKQWAEEMMGEEQFEEYLENNCQKGE